MMIRRLLLMVVLQLFVIVPAVTAATSVKIPELQHGATIIRDHNGIPHIFAMNEHDLILLQGYAHARDRFFQMDLLRRNAAGTLAELLGENVLAGDVELRTIGLRRAAERSLAVISEEMRAALRAYASGVNAYLANSDLPPEYYALEITKVAPWTQLDSLAVAKLIAFSLSFDLEDISRTEALLTYQMVGDLSSQSFNGRALFFEDLFRSAPFVPLSTIPFGGGDAYFLAQSRIDSARHATPQSSHTPGTGEYLQPKTLQLVRAYVNRVQTVPLLRNMLLSDRSAKGSNEWVVGGDHTASGLPLIANDPHLPLGTPATFYQNHLSAMHTGFPGLHAKKSRINVFGSSFPGLPYVMLGQNKYIAWGTTFNPSDVTDFFQEQVVSDKSSPSGLSIIHKDRLEPIIPLPQVFWFNVIGDGTPDSLEVAIPGTPVGDDTVIPPAVLIVPRRNNGPILSLDFDEDKGIGIALSVQYTGFSGTRDSESVRLWNHARNMDEFIAGAQILDVGAQNIAYADIDGNIAYFTSPEIPLREDLQAGFVAGIPPYFIRNGPGGHEWLPVQNPQPWQSVPFEILPFDEMPQVINPADGFLISANNDPIGTTFDNNPVNQMRDGGQGILYLNHGYRIGIRAGRIHQVLGEMLSRGPVTFEDMQEIQADVVMLDAQVFTPFIIEAFDNATAQTAAAHPLLLNLRQNTGVKEALERLRAWDFSTPTGVAEGYDSSDIDGEKFEPSALEIENSIAATIYSVWRSRFIANTVDQTLLAVGGLAGIEMPRPDSMRTMTALRNLLDHFDDNQGFGVSGLNFFMVPEVEDAPARRDIIILQSLAEALDMLADQAFADAFGGSSNQADYRWGRLHRIVFDHPLGTPFSIPPAAGGFPASFDDLPGLATDGGFGVVDASSHDVRADGSNGFMFEFGPVRRYVGQISQNRHSSQAATNLPGGASGILGSAFYDNLLPRWLTNDTYPIKQELCDLFGDIAEIDIFWPDSWKR
ncbi:Penicillin amidase precursor (EC [Olavius sp. associated proteobacterium Delta 1]|nr:Penicillin amidase precursor (EC [Olavius sp. associated proteobacterium Delta 1]